MEMSGSSSTKTQGVFNKRRCRDCGERLNVNNFPTISFDCRHRPVVCHFCLLQRVGTHLDEGNAFEMPCPYPKCVFTLTPAGVRRLPFSEDTILQYIAAVSPAAAAPVLSPACDGNGANVSTSTSSDMISVASTPPTARDVPATAPPKPTAPLS